MGCNAVNAVVAVNAVDAVNAVNAVIAVNMVTAITAVTDDASVGLKLHGMAVRNQSCRVVARQQQKLHEVGPERALCAAVGIIALMR
jgi:hypothetical protein